MDLPLSEQASLEVRREIEAACRLPFADKALDVFMSGFADNFKKRCDAPKTGSKFWARYGENMRSNGRYIGTLAEYFAKNKSNETVEMPELWVALEIVRVTCDKRIHLGAIVPRGYMICDRVKGNKAAGDAFKDFLKAVFPNPAASGYRYAKPRRGPK